MLNPLKVLIGLIVVVLLWLPSLSTTLSCHVPPKQIVQNLEQATNWLEQKCQELIRAARRPMNNGVQAFLPQAGKGYDAFWLRDYVYMLEGCANAFTPDELRQACTLFITAARTDGAGVDCIKLDGTPIYKPGFGTMGQNPVADGSLFTISLAWHTHQILHDKAYLAEMIDRLKHILKAAPRSPTTKLIHIATTGYDRCPYGFMDTVHQQGDIFFCSLLLVQAETQLADLMTIVGRIDEAEVYRRDAEKLISHIHQIFWDAEAGLFRAATHRCREHDLWGSAFAVHLGLTTSEQTERIAQYLVQHHGEVFYRGQLRHLPAGVYWQEAGPRDAYQNGGFWATPTGWAAVTLQRVNPQLAERTIVSLVQDFQCNGVAEWIYDSKRAVPNYVASVAMPLAGARRLMQLRTKK